MTTAVVAVVELGMEQYQLTTYLVVDFVVIRECIPTKAGDVPTFLGGILSLRKSAKPTLLIQNVSTTTQTISSH